MDDMEMFEVLEERRKAEREALVLQTMLAVLPSVPQEWFACDAPTLAREVGSIASAFILEAQERALVE